MFDQITEFILHAAQSPWVVLILGGLILIDALIPVVPSESIVISLASIYVTINWKLLPFLFIFSVVCAWIGDNMAYQVGRWRRIGELKILQLPKIQSLLSWSGRMLNERGATIIIVGRFIPGVRIAINLMCGIVKYPRKRFAGVVCISASLWAAYSVMIGALAGHWFQENHLLGICVAIAAGIILGPLIDWAIRKLVLKTDNKAAPSEPESA